MRSPRTQAPTRLGPDLSSRACKLACMLLLFSGCVVGVDGTAPCASDDTCLPGFRCVDGLCAPCTVDECPGRLGAGVGPGGGVVCSREDVCLHVPEGALDRAIAIVITATRSASLAASGVRPLSSVQSIEPAGTSFIVPARIELPISSTVAAARIGVWRAPALEGPWTRLTGTSTAVAAIGLTDSTGFFAAGIE